MELLRVLYLINDLRPYGGAEVALANLVNSLDHSKLDVWVGGLYNRGALVRQLDLPSDHVISFNCRSKFYLDVASLWRLKRFLKEKRIQVIHTHLFASNTIGRIAACLAGVPVIIATEHNTYVHKGRLSAKIDWALAHATSQLIAVSDAVRSFAASQAGLSLDRFIVIPNGLPLDQIPILSAEQKSQKRRHLGIGDNRAVVISVGRLTKQKGFPVLIRAAQLVLEKHPFAMFLIVGTGELKDELCRQIESAGLQASIRLLGYRNDVYELLQISSLLAMSSFWEGFGVILAEAGANTLPVVASNVGGVSEVVRNGESGLLVPPGDDGALAAAISRLLALPETCRRMGECGRKLVENQFSAKRIAQQTTDMYWQLWDLQRNKRIGLQW